MDGSDRVIQRAGTERFPLTGYLLMCNHIFINQLHQR